MIHPQEIQRANGSFRTRAGGGTPTILIVDDCAEVLDSLRVILESHNYSVTAATSAIEALKMIAVEPPDLIVSDWMMPEVDGMYFHEEVRQNPVLSDVPFIFLTAVTSEEDRRQAKLNGCDDYITKPFHPDDLLAVIGGKLSVSRRRQKFAQASLETQYRRIIHALSHEFRTPLVSINTGAEVLRDQLKVLPHEQAMMLLDSIWRGGRRMERLVEDFMTMQQIDLGFAAQASEAHRCRVPLFSLVETAVEQFVDRLPAASAPPRVRVRHVLQEGEPPGVVEVYDIHVNDVLQRLLCNAGKFGGEHGEIDVCVRYRERCGLITVRDQGPGFVDPAQANGAFEPFRQIDRERQEQQGVGIGLTIARFLANLNGIALHFHKPHDGGSGVEAQLRFELLE